MNAARLKQIEEIYQMAADSVPDYRAALLESKCSGDEVLRQEVQTLLSYEDISDSFIDSSPGGIAAEMFASDDIAPKLVGTTIGHYEILRMIGEGGMGEVYLADDTLLDRKVALKIVPPGLIEHHDRLKRFKQEAKAASALNHPNILTIHEFGTEDDSHYIVSEFVDGITLRQKMRDARLSVREIFEIAMQAASALAAAHEAGIIHRDIKPENIMIRRDGILKVLDFGLAKLTMPTPADPNSGMEAKTLFKTEPGLIMGTVNYMSPEQARGVKVDERTDIWSLGVIMYEMAAGQRPFEGPTQTDVLVAILNTSVPMMEIYVDDAPAELERIIDKTLAKNAAERYQSIEELAADLKRFHHRLEFEAEMKQAHNDLHSTRDERGRGSETATRMMRADGTGQVTGAGNAGAENKSKASVFMLTAVITFLALASVIGVVVWQSKGSESNVGQIANPDPPAVADPAPLSRFLNYSLTVQSYTDGRYKEPFTLSSEMLFRNKDRIRLNINSPQTGYLYILNQGPKLDYGEASYNILFPSPMTNEGSAKLSADQEIQIPRQSWFELDTKEGTELVWLVWSENALSEFEAAKRFANADDKGRIKDRELSTKIDRLLQEQRSNKKNVERDEIKKETRITGNAGIVTHIIKLEHH